VPQGSRVNRVPTRGNAVQTPKNNARRIPSQTPSRLSNPPIRLDY
jgi:hypothetical protein